VLALAAGVTRIKDRPDPVPDDIWNEAARHYDERGLASLLVAIGTINVWNRLNVATRQVAFGRIPEAAASWSRCNGRRHVLRALRHRFAA